MTGTGPDFVKIQYYEPIVKRGKDIFLIKSATDMRAHLSWKLPRIAITTELYFARADNKKRGAGGKMGH